MGPPRALKTWPGRRLPDQQPAPQAQQTEQLHQPGIAQARGQAAVTMQQRTQVISQPRAIQSVAGADAGLSACSRIRTPCANAGKAFASSTPASRRRNRCRCRWLQRGRPCRFGGDFASELRNVHADDPAHQGPARCTRRPKRDRAAGLHRDRAAARPSKSGSLSPSWSATIRWMDCRRSVVGAGVDVTRRRSSRCPSCSSVALGDAGGVASGAGGAADVVSRGADETRGC